MKGGDGLSERAWWPEVLCYLPYKGEGRGRQLLITGPGCGESVVPLLVLWWWLSVMGSLKEHDG